MRNIPFEDQTKSFFLSFGQGFSFLKKVQNQFKMLLELSIFLASTVPIKKNANIMAVTKQFRDLIMVVESVEPGCFFTDILSLYRSTQRRQKQTKQAFSLLKSDELGTQQTIVA